MSTIQTARLRGRRFPLGLFIAGFAVCDFFVPLIMDNLGYAIRWVALVGMLLGVMAGQFGLLIIWAVLGPGTAAVRQALTILIAAFLWSSFFAGFAVVDLPFGVDREVWTSFLFLPLVFLIAQLPLWGMKLTTGGRIVHRDRMAGQSPTEGRQFGLRQVMGTTALVAVAFSMANSGLAILGGDAIEGWGPLLAGSLVCALWCPFVTRPCIWAALSAKKKGVAALALGIYTGLMTMLILGVMTIFSGGSLYEEFVLMVLAFHIALMSVILGTLHVARLCGYTFISRRHPQPVLPSDCPFAVGDDSCGGTEAARQR